MRYSFTNIFILRNNNINLEVTIFSIICVPTLIYRSTFLIYKIFIYDTNYLIYI